ncbi:MAG: GreA/GreB family elongation factor [Moraxellaceae bacterium]
MGMHSRVHFRNEANGHEHSVLLAWPETAAQHPGGLSVLTPAGAALLGLRTGNVIDWPAHAGLLRLRLLATTPV